MATVNNMEDLTRFRHLQESGLWSDAPLPNGKVALVPVIFVNLSETPMKVRRWAPSLGEHTGEVLGDLVGMATSQIGDASGRASR